MVFSSSVFTLSCFQIAIRSTVFLLKQQKRSHKKISVDPLSFSEGKRAEGPGERADNMWVQYCSETRPLTAEEWDTPRYIHKAYHGFYCWPKWVTQLTCFSILMSHDPVGSLLKALKLSVEASLFEKWTSVCLVVDVNSWIRLCSSTSFSGMQCIV